MASRALTRVHALGRAAVSSLAAGPRARPQHPARILVLHELLLGDTLMLAALFSALRGRYPSAAIYSTAKPQIVPLFAARPYGVVGLPFSERDPRWLQSLAPARGADLAILPGESRYALHARAIGARWIIGLSGARPAWKGWLVDEQVDWPAQPRGLADIFASLAGEAAPARYRVGDWPAPPHRAFDLPRKPYAVLHVGASTPLKYWPQERWSALAEKLSAKYSVVWSAGPGEQGLLAGRQPAYPGTLDLTQLWHLVANASLLVTLDTGVAHLAKLTGTPTVALYGPGSAVLVGRGEFFADLPFSEMTAQDFPCRDQRVLFKREIEWVRRCGRTLDECSRPRCMEAIALQQVLDAVEDR